MVAGRQETKRNRYTCAEVPEGGVKPGEAVRGRRKEQWLTETETETETVTLPAAERGESGAARHTRHERTIAGGRHARQAAAKPAQIEHR